MVLPPLTEIRARRNGAQAHFAHVALNGLAIDDQLLAKLGRNFARTIEWPLRIDLIYPALDPEVFWRWRHRLIIQPAAIQTEQFGLHTHRQFSIRPVHQRESLTSREVRDQIFF